MKLRYLIPLLCASLSVAAQTTIIQPQVTPIASLNVSASPSTIGIGQVSTVTVREVDANSQLNNFYNYCPLQTSNSAVASVSGNMVTGVSAGTATITCTKGTYLGNPVTGSTSITVSGNPVITNPTCATQPCVLPGGTVTVAYTNYTFAAYDPGQTLTWSNSSGSPPTGLSLSSSGVLSGTPSGSAGTTTWTVQVTDGVNTPATVQVSVTIIAASNNCTTTPGPPTYYCSSTSTLAATGPLKEYFDSRVASGIVTCNGATPTVCTYVSGDAFSTAWYGGGASMGQVYVNGNVQHVTTWGSTTVTLVGTCTTCGGDSAVSYVNYASCIGTGVNGTGGVYDVVF